MPSRPGLICARRCGADSPAKPRASADHIDLPHRLADAAGALPALGEEGDSVGLDLDHLTGFMGVGAAAGDEMAILVAGHVAIPMAGGAGPDAALPPPARPLVKQDPRGHRLP